MLGRPTVATFLLLAVTSAVAAFVPHSQRHTQTHAVRLRPLSAEQQPNRRRAFLNGVAAAVAASFLTVGPPASAEQVKEYRQGIEVNAFNGLIFNYRGGAYAGLDAEDLNEPSVSYAEFNERLKAGEVAFVEFLAPDGDAAYVTFKAKQGESAPAPIRIGEGYPVEQHDGYSSPMFCVRAVKNAGVPYKFIVPALSKFQASTSKSTYP